MGEKRREPPDSPERTPWWATYDHNRKPKPHRYMVLKRWGTGVIAVAVVLLMVRLLL